MKEFFLNETCADGYIPYRILLDDTKELNAIADRQQKAKGKLPLFDDSGEYDDQNWYDFFLECDVNGVSKMYYQYGLDSEYGDEIELTKEDKAKAFKAVLDFFGGIEAYKEYMEEYDG